jgi:zinc transporter
MVWGYLFAPGQSPRLVDCDAAAELLAGRSGRQSDWFLWLHFSLSNAASARWLHQNLSLPDGFYESLHEAVGSTRLEQEGDSLLAVIHDVLFDFQFDASDVSTVTLCVEPRVLVSARPRPVRSIDRLRASVKAGTTFRSTAGLLAHLLQDQAGVLVEIVRQSTSRVDVIEDQLLKNQISTSRAELGTLRRVLVRLQRLLAPEPAALFRLLSRPPEWIGEDDVQDLRQSAEEFSTVVTDSGSLVERIRLIQEELAAQINEQNNRILFLLTVVTVLALPVNLISGLFGMNVGGIPLAEHRDGFWTVVGVVGSVTAVLSFLALRGRWR